MKKEERPILLVEDNPDDLELALRAFRKNNVHNPIVVARDGVEAMDWLNGSGAHEGCEPGLPQVVLLDLRMPRLGGLEVLEKIRADPRTRRLPVVIMTSSTEEEDLVRGYDLGANSYIRKPVDFNQFIEAVSHLGLYWLVMNEVPRGG